MGAALWLYAAAVTYRCADGRSDTFPLAVLASSLNEAEHKIDALATSYLLERDIAPVVARYTSVSRMEAAPADQKEISRVMAHLGSRKSERKAKSSAANGRLGGRPPKAKP